MRRADDIPASLINLRINVAESFGASRSDILRESGIEPEIFSDPKSRVSVGQAIAVWEAIARSTGSQNMGLESGLRIRLQYLGILGYVIMNSPSLLVAYEKFCVHQRLVNAIMFIKLILEKDIVTLEGDMQVPWKPAFRYTIDFMMAGHLAVIQNSTAKEVTLLEIGFHFPEPENTNRYQEIFGPAEIRFSCPKTYLVCRRSDMDAKVVGTSPEMFQQFELQLEDQINEHDGINSCSRQVKQLIAKGLKAEIPTIEQVSREMAMSVRSLQSNLKEEETTYQAILNSVRQEVSIAQLRNPTNNISDVAFLAGFSDLSVFSRSFKKWTGVSPSQFQASL